MKNKRGFWAYTIIIIIFSKELFSACTPAGTAGDDTVNCTGSINAFQHFYGGSDSVTLTGVTARAYNNSYWLDEALGGNPATDGNDTFISNNSHFYWVLGFGGDDSFSITNSEFNNIYGDTNPGHGTSQRGNDTFLIVNSTSYGYILGGNDNDYIEIKDSNVSNVAAGYSNIYSGADYSPFDGNDTIILDHVNFNTPLYWSPSETHGVLASGRGDDNITFKNGGEVYYVYGGHGNDHIEFFDNIHFNDCNTSILTTDTCGIYGDEAYTSELNASMIPFLHGDDTIILHDGDFSSILIQGGDGSDKVVIETTTNITAATLNGGDDRDSADTFVDQLSFKQWTGDLNGSQLLNWEQIVLNDNSKITLLDNTLSAGTNSGLDAASGLPYGLSIQNNAELFIDHSFFIDGNVYNASIINMQDGNTPGNVLTVAHSYTSSNASLYLDVVLNDASTSMADRLEVQGDTQGDTTLYINNINGLGGQTPTGNNVGILLIEIQGASNATFQLSSPLQAGEYIYTLHKGSNGNWYLQSHKDMAGIKLVKTVDKTSISKPELLNYTIMVTNTGNIVLNTIEVTDTLPNGMTQTLTLQSGDTNQNNKLDLNEKWLYTTTFNATQDDIDIGKTLINLAKVSTSDSVSDVGSAYTQILQNNNYSFIKSTTSTPRHVGDSLLYTFTVKNLGNTRLEVSKITDENCKSTIQLKSESSVQNTLLDIDEEQTYTCTSLPITAYEAKVCEVINVANIAVNTYLSDTLLQEKTSKVTTPISIPDPCPCETAILTRPPLMPTNSYVPLLTSTSASIRWEDNAFNEIGFRIYRNNILIGTTRKNETSFSLNNLQARTTYTYIIKSYNSYGESYRATITFTTKDDYAWLPAIYNLML